MSRDDDDASFRKNDNDGNINTKNSNGGSLSASLSLTAGTIIDSCGH
jgi:hypothetical protein